MSTDSLIKIIAEEVLKRIKESQDCMHIVSDEATLILDEDSQKNRNKYKYINSNGNKIKFLNEFCIEDITSLTYIIAPSLSNIDIGNIALGLGQSEASKVIIEGILRGTKVIVLDEGIEYKKFAKTANSNFIKVFREHEEKLIEFGVEILSNEELHRVFQYRNLETDKKAQRKTKEMFLSEAAINKKAITEKDMYDAHCKGYKTIYIDKKSIITPLALDYIKLNSINIART
ncbi:DUF87 domain-containing protein [Wukongibacter baidiensis]|uniref:hypothetical protein n=1 Tax=Wukongibacter baidiensis TaxID=1723361 RepID=UPI003D7F1FA3